MQCLHFTINTFFFFDFRKKMKDYESSGIVSNRIMYTEMDNKLCKSLSIVANFGYAFEANNPCSCIQITIMCFLRTTSKSLRVCVQTLLLNACSSFHKIIFGEKVPTL